MKYTYFLVVFLPGLYSHVLAQTDTTTKRSELKEVIIVNDRDEHDAFSFYRTGKLNTTEDILARIPGVNMIRRGAFGLEPSLRIYSSGQINVTIDGMKLHGACTDKMDPASIYIEPNTMDEISVVHGTSGSIMGSTIGGTLNMGLKKPMFTDKRSLFMKLSQSYSTVNSGTASSIYVNAASRKLASNFGFVYRKANSYKDGNGDKVAFSQYEKINWSGGLAYRASAKNTFSIQYLGDKGMNIGFPALTMDVGVATAHITSFSHKFIKQQGYLRQTESKFYYNHVYHSMDDTKRPSVPIHMDMPGWSETLGAYNESLFRGKKHDLTTRIDAYTGYARADMIMYPRNEATMYMQTLPTNRLNNVGGFVQYTHAIDSTQLVRANMRLDYYHQFAYETIGSSQWQVMSQDVTKPRVDFLKNGSLTYLKMLNKRIEASITAGYGERLPTSNERYGYYLYIRLDGFDYLGNPDLSPERSWQSELKLKLDAGRVQPYVNLFYHYITNYIYPFIYTGYSPMTIGARGVKGYANIQSATAQGLEAGITYKPLRNLFYIGTIRYTYAFANSGMPLPQVSPLKLQQALRYEYRKFQIQAEYDLAAAQRRINIQSGELSTPGWQLANMRVARNFGLSKSAIQLSIACENIFDTWYREHLDWGRIGRPGRNFSFLISYMIP